MQVSIMLEKAVNRCEFFATNVAYFLLVILAVDFFYVLIYTDVGFEFFFALITAELVLFGFGIMHLNGHTRLNCI